MAQAARKTVPPPSGAHKSISSVANAAKTLPLAKKSKKVEGGDNPKQVFALLRAQLAEVKTELSPYNWYNHVNDYNQEKKAKQKLRMLVDVAEDGPLKNVEVEETSPEFNARVDTLMLSEHVKAKCMEANGVFSKAGQLLMQAHYCLAKDFFLVEDFIEAITNIPENTQDEMEMQMKKIKQMTSQIEELEADNKNHVITALRRKNVTRENLSNRFNSERLSRFYGGLVANWAFQSQREQVLCLREQKSSLEVDLSSMTTKYETTEKEYSKALNAWHEERSKLTADLEELREIFEQQKREAEQALSEAASQSADQATTITLLTKERVLLQKRIVETEAQNTTLEENLKSVSDQLQTRGNELEACKALLSQTEKELAQSKEEFLKQQQTISELHEEAQSLQSTFSAFVMAQRSRAKQRLDRVFGFTPPAILRRAFTTWARIVPELNLERSLDDVTLSFEGAAFSLADLEGAVNSGRFQAKNALHDLLKGSKLEEQLKLLQEELDGSVDEWTVVLKTKAGEYELSSGAPDWEVDEYKFFAGGRGCMNQNQMPKSVEINAESKDDLPEDHPARVEARLAMPVDIMPVLRAAEAAIRSIATESESPPPSPWRDPTLQFTASEFFRKRAANKKLHDTANSLLQVANALKKGPQARKNRMNAALATLQKVADEARDKKMLIPKEKVAEASRSQYLSMPHTPGSRRRPLPPPMISNEALERRILNAPPPRAPSSTRPLRRVVSEIRNLR